MAQQVIVLVGHRGSGKSEAARHLAGEAGFYPFAMSTPLKILATRRGLDPEDRDVLITLGEELRSQNGLGGVALLACEHLTGGNLGADARIVIEGVRTPQELEVIREYFGGTNVLAVGVEMDDEVRQQLLVGRGYQYLERGGSVVHDSKERGVGTTMNIPETLRYCDRTIENTGTDEFFARLLQEIGEWQMAREV